MDRQLEARFDEFWAVNKTNIQDQYELSKRREEEIEEE